MEKWLFLVFDIAVSPFSWLVITFTFIAFWNTIIYLASLILIALPFTKIITERLKSEERAEANENYCAVLNPISKKEYISNCTWFNWQDIEIKYVVMCCYKKFFLIKCDYSYLCEWIIVWTLWNTHTHTQNKIKLYAVLTIYFIIIYFKFRLHFQTLFVILYGIDSCTVQTNSSFVPL